MFFGEEEFKKKKKKFTKNDMIYGIFNEEEESSSDDNPLEGQKRLMSLLAPGKSIGGFVNSTTLLHDPSTEVTVRWGDGTKQKADSSRTRKLEETLNMIKEFDHERGKPSKAEPELKRKRKNLEEDGDDIFSEEEKEELAKEQEEKEKIQKKRIFDFKRKGDQAQIDMSLHNLPSAFGAKTEEPEIKNKIKLSTEMYAEKIESEKLNSQYGVGYKILKNLGFKEGKGLGKNKQGRVKPVEAVSKSKFNSDFEMRLDGIKKNKETDEERFSKYDIADDIFQDLEEKDELHESSKERLEQGESVIQKRWSKNKDKRYFREPKKEKRKGENKDVTDALKPVVAHQKIVDMRGPNVMFYDDMNILGKITKNSVSADEDGSEKKATILGELVVNIKGALERQKHNLRVSSQRLSLEKDKIVTFEYECKKLKAELETAIGEHEILKTFRDELKRLEVLGNDQTQLSKLFPEEIVRQYNDLYEISAENFLKYNCHFSMINSLAIRMKPLFNANNLLSAIISHYSLFERISKLLNTVYEHKLSKLPEGKEKRQGSTSSQAESSKTQKAQALILEGQQLMNLLLENTILAHLRSFLINEWLPREESDLVIDLLKMFQFVFPEIFLDNIVENLIVRRLVEEVKAWDPKKDKIMIHLWVHPWLEIIEEAKLSPLWRLIQNRLAEALKQWSPADKSALYLLSPWKSIWDSATWNNFMMRCIMPKLIHAISEFEINLKDQKIDVIRWIAIWFEILEEEQICMLLEEWVLKKIDSMADLWLKNIETKEEVKDLLLWVDGWKRLLGPRALQCENIAVFFKEMDRKVARALV